MSRLLDAKHRLMPYIYTHVSCCCLTMVCTDSGQAINAHDNGHPLPRAMFLEFLEDRTTHYLDRQYMFGPSLLVAPVFVAQEEEAEYYIPAGRWTSLFDFQRTILGPVWVHEKVPLDEIPVWIRPNTVLCLGATGQGRPDYALNRSVEVHLYEYAEGIESVVALSPASGTVVDSIRVARSSDGIAVRVIDDSTTISSVVLHGEYPAIRRFIGGRTLGNAIGVEVDKDQREVIIEF